MAGELVLVVEGGLDPDLRRVKGEATDEASEPSLSRSLSGPALGTLLARFRREDVNVELEIDIGEGRSTIRYATLVVAPGTPEDRSLYLLTPLVGESDPPVGAAVQIHLAHERSLHRFRSTVRGVRPIPLGKTLALPLLEIDPPSALEPGQRRRAFRIRPEKTLPVTIGPLLLDQGLPDTFEPFASVSAAATDLSFLGAGLVSDDPRAGLHLAEGMVVLCEIDLGETAGRPELLGIVRRIERVATPSGKERYRIGIEFLRDPSWRRYEPPYERLCEYVMAEERSATRRAKGLGEG
jgi:c-di-GMP-binding flagellar brake protein YcgR